MATRTETVRVGDRETTMTRYPAAGAFARLIFAPGAGTNQRQAFLVRLAGDLAERGVEVTTFDFLYAAAGRRSPDPPAALEACYRAVIARVEGPMFAGGKSMGGRIASQVVAQGATESDGERDKERDGENGASGASGVKGLVFAGYPLHPPGKPETLRTAHWPKVRVPSLFVQGTRDPFGGPDELAVHLPRLGAPPKVLAIDGGDHSLSVPKRGKTPQADVDEAIRAAIVAFLRDVSGGAVTR